MIENVCTTVNEFDWMRKDREYDDQYELPFINAKDSLRIKVDT